MSQQTTNTGVSRWLWGFKDADVIATSTSRMWPGLCCMTSLLPPLVSCHLSSTHDRHEGKDHFLKVTTSVITQPKLYIVLLCLKMPLMPLRTPGVSLKRIRFQFPVPATDCHFLYVLISGVRHLFFLPSDWSTNWNKSVDELDWDVMIQRKLCFNHSI